MKWLWCARLTWVLLPVSAGTALGDALDGWATAPARVAEVWLWTAWALGLLALLAPRLWGLTVLRVLAPAAVVVASLAAAHTGATAATLAISSTMVAGALALSAPVAQASANAGAYGDEVRFPLRVPLSLFLGPVPLAVALIAIGVTAGPLLLADGRYVAGALTTVVGVAVAAPLARSLHSLSRRWLVVVPAGLVVVDPLTLADPVLMRREQIVSVGRSADRPPRPTGLDLRLGTTAGTVALTLAKPQSFARRSGRRAVALQDADQVLVSTVQADTVVRTAIARRITA